MAKSSPSEYVKTLLGKYPLVGVMKQMRPPLRPHDAQWLPPDWEGAVYPRGSSDGDNTRAIMEWLAFESERLQWQAQESRRFLQNHPDLKDSCGFDETSVIRNAVRVSACCRDRYAWTNPPAEPDRKYTRLPEDLAAAIRELETVQKWVVDWCQASPRGQATKDPKRKRKRKPDPKASKKREERDKRWNMEEAILSDWEKHEWTDYNDYATWKNEQLPEGWPTLNHQSIERAIQNANRRARYRKK